MKNTEKSNRTVVAQFQTLQLRSNLPSPKINSAATAADTQSITHYIPEIAIYIQATVIRNRAITAYIQETNTYIRATAADSRETAID